MRSLGGSMRPFGRSSTTRLLVQSGRWSHQRRVRGGSSDRIGWGPIRGVRSVRAPRTQSGRGETSGGFECRSAAPARATARKRAERPLLSHASAPFRDAYGPPRTVVRCLRVSSRPLPRAPAATGAGSPRTGGERFADEDQGGQRSTSSWTAFPGGEFRILPLFRRPYDMRRSSYEARPSSPLPRVATQPVSRRLPRSRPGWPLSRERRSP